MASDSESMASDSESTSHLSPKRPHQSPQTSPTKRPKTLTHKPCDGSTKPLDSEPQGCGICLSEDGKTIRGCIDSCDHYFCFVCIMEWAKVESRCPMCKQRFGTIRRPPKCGVFLTERVVNVPVRDQVYHCFGNATLVSSNPYSEVRCTVCKSEADESLLLLCDLCDSAAHTYCVGLGATVPEGDWFCQDCTATKAEHEKTETYRDYESQTSSSNIHKSPVAETHVSIFDIVRESRFREVERPTTVSLLPNELSSPVVPETCLADSMTGQGSRTGGRTLKRCRNVHGRIRSLRENWNAFRSGSLRFSSSLVDSRVTENQRNSSDTILCNSSGQPLSIACSSQQLDAKKSSSFNKMPNRSPCVVDKAWKMMDVAKSVERARERTSIVHQASKHPFSKVSNLKEKTNANSNLLASSSKLIGTKNPANSGPQKNYQFCSPVEGNERHMSQMVLKQKNGIIITERILKFCESSPSAQSLSKHELPSSTNVQTSVHLDVHSRNGGKPSEIFLPRTTSGVFNKHDGSACLISPAKSVTAASNTCCAELDVSSSSKMKLSNRKATMEKSCAGKKSTRDDDAKSEIQSLVKLNLKLLSRDRTLGVDAFKEIARLATHSILAACGLERPKPGVRSFSSTVCCHTNQVQQLRMSTLMPTSCRECFYVFVKDVVNTIMFEKIGNCIKMSS